LSSGSDGLLKLWTIKTSECVNTFDAHEGKVWALEPSKEQKHFFSGGSDAVIKVWEDRTLEEEEENFSKNQELLLKFILFYSILLIKALSYST